MRVRWRRDWTRKDGQPAPFWIACPSVPRMTPTRRARAMLPTRVAPTARQSVGVRTQRLARPRSVATRPVTRPLLDPVVDVGTGGCGDPPGSPTTGRLLVRPARERSRCSGTSKPSHHGTPALNARLGGYRCRRESPSGGEPSVRTERGRRCQEQRSVAHMSPRRSSDRSPIWASHRAEPDASSLNARLAGPDRDLEGTVRPSNLNSCLSAATLSARLAGIAAADPLRASRHVASCEVGYRSQSPRCSRKQVGQSGP